MTFLNNVLPWILLAGTVIYFIVSQKGQAIRSWWNKQKVANPTIVAGGNPPSPGSKTSWWTDEKTKRLSRNGRMTAIVLSVILCGMVVFPASYAIINPKGAIAWWGSPSVWYWIVGCVIILPWFGYPNPKDDTWVTKLQVFFILWFVGSWIVLYATSDHKKELPSSIPSNKVDSKASEAERASAKAEAEAKQREEAAKDMSKDVAAAAQAATTAAPKPIGHCIPEDHKEYKVPAGRKMSARVMTYDKEVMKAAGLSKEEFAKYRYRIQPKYGTELIEFANGNSALQREISNPPKPHVADGKKLDFPAGIYYFTYQNVTEEEAAVEIWWEKVEN